MSGNAGITAVYNPTAAITATGGSTLLLPKTFNSSSPLKRGCLYSHYDGGNSQSVMWLRPWWDIGFQLPVLALDYDQGNVSPWGDPQQMTDMASGYTYLNSTLGAAIGGKINLLGFSMGGCNSLVYAAHSPGKVQSILLGSPALSIYDAMYAPGVNLGGQINTAYGIANQAAFLTTNDPTWPTGDSGANGGATGTSIAANRDPYYMAGTGAVPAVFASIPIVIIQGGIKLSGLTISNVASGTTVPTSTTLSAILAAGQITVDSGGTTGYPTRGQLFVKRTSIPASFADCVLFNYTGISGNDFTGVTLASNSPVTGSASFATNAAVGGVATVTGSGITTSNVNTGMWMTWQGMNTSLESVVSSVSAGSVTLTTSAALPTTPTSCWFAVDGTTWPIWAEQFAAWVNTAGGNVQMVYDNFGGHGLYSDAAIAQAMSLWLPYS